MGTCVPTDGQVCAVLNTEQGDKISEGASLTISTGEIPNLGQVFNGPGSTWKNLISSAEVRPGCVLETYDKPVYKTMINLIKAPEDTSISHNMDATHEDNKIESLKCSCDERTCVDDYTYGGSVKKGCPAPTCGIISYDICDKWKKKQNSKWQYGVAIRIHIPQEYQTSKGWSMIVRFNGAHSASGSFQLWNANFFNIYRHDTGLELHMQQKYWLGGDLDDQNSVLLVAERLPTGAMPEIYFWTSRQNNHNCFDQNSSRGIGGLFDRAVELTDGVNTFEDVSRVLVSRGGNVRVRP